MLFKATPLAGAYTIEVEKFNDHRGSFFRAFCSEEFKKHNLEYNFLQANISSNVRMGVLRGLHYQKGDASEVKLVRCVRGEILDVIVDIRQNSSTYLQHFSAKLTEDNHTSMYVPRGFAHGYQTLTDDAVVHYMVSALYTPGSEAGIRYDDPTLSIEWPLAPTEISEKDSSWQLLEV